jgi:O-antigen biosynthesis protein
VLTTLPLVALSSTFHWLFPLAIASLALSLTVCFVASAQASLPRNKRRWWSRPVVALLFFLQPIARGWARYQGQLGLQSTPPVKETLDSVAMRSNAKCLGELCYWGDQSVDRIQLVRDVIERFDREGWTNKSDIGWSEYDLEVRGNRWTRLQLTTVAEDYPRGRKMIRCRLRAGWSLPAKVAFWAALGFELLVIGVVGKWLPSLRLLLFSMPLFAWFLVREKRALQSLMVVLLDEVAKKWRMARVPLAETAKPAARDTKK